MSVTICTSLGDIVVQLFTTDRPKTCFNFLKLCKIKYFHGSTFHFVEKDFIAQAGDPTAEGDGGESIYRLLGGDSKCFQPEVRICLRLTHSKKGTLSMASSKLGHASQFLITLRDDLTYLDGQCTVFGKVVDGFNTLNAINECVVYSEKRPIVNIRIKHTRIHSDPYDDPPELLKLIPKVSPEGKPKVEVGKLTLEYERLQLTAAEADESGRATDARSNALILEIAGEIPYAEIKPDENVLFVCKLNPATQAESLGKTFSQYGRVTSAKVVLDKKTGDSKCFGFVAYETKEICDKAYLETQKRSVYVDGSKVHVDFSQSTTKSWRRFGQERARQGSAAAAKHMRKTGGEKRHEISERQRKLDSRASYERCSNKEGRGRKQSTPDHGSYERKSEHKRHSRKNDGRRSYRGLDSSDDDS